MAKYLVQIVVTGMQVVGRAFSKALKQEFQASQHAAQRSSNRREGSKRAAADSLSGISLQEAKHILNITEIESEKVSQNYEHLFSVNDKSKGGSFYIQSKVVRAKERMDMELKNKPEEHTEELPKS